MKKRLWREEEDSLDGLNLKKKVSFCYWMVQSVVVAGKMELFP